MRNVYEENDLTPGFCLAGRVLNTNFHPLKKKFAFLICVSTLYIRYLYFLREYVLYYTCKKLYG